MYKKRKEIEGRKGKTKFIEFLKERLRSLFKKSTLRVIKLKDRKRGGEGTEAISLLFISNSFSHFSFHFMDVSSSHHNFRLHSLLIISTKAVWQELSFKFYAIYIYIYMKTMWKWGEEKQRWRRRRTEKGNERELTLEVTTWNRGGIRGDIF